MDIYLEEDKKQVVKVFTDIKEDLLKACADDADKSQVIEALADSIRRIKVLEFNLKHMEGFDDSNASDTNKEGLAVLKNTIKRFCEDIDQSVEDTSWIEGADTYAESQKAAVDEMIKAIADNQLTGAAKADAEHSLEMMKSITPPEGAADWVIREMRNQMLLAGIKSHLNTNLISAVEI